MTLLLLAACDFSLIEAALTPDEPDEPPADTGDTAVDGDTLYCSGWSPTLPASVTADPTCSLPRSGPFDPVVEWAWPANQAQALSGVMTTPAVAAVYDSDGDSVVTIADAPSVLAVAFENDDYTGYGTLVILDGKTGAEQLLLPSVTDTNGDVFHFAAQTGIAVGDLDRDGIPEICVGGREVSVLCVTPTGATKWVGKGETYLAGAPAMADFDADGLGDVSIGRSMFTFDGTLLGTGGYGPGGFNIGMWTLNVTTPYDVDADGYGDLLAGNAAYERDGQALWADGAVADDFDGFPAIADFDGDNEPEMVSVETDGWLVVRDRHGVVLAKQVRPNWWRGGPPVVANFDADPLPELGVASGEFTVYDDVAGTPTVIATFPLVDTTSAHAGATAFDFNDDGIDEVVIADEERLRVWDVAQGIDLMDGNLTGFDPLVHESGTGTEYPVVADVDLDGSAEIVVASVDSAHVVADTAAEWRGIHVIGSSRGIWPSARPLWNQHAWSPGNIDDDLAISTPTDQAATLARFRAPVVEPWPAAANLVAVEVQSCGADCWDQEIDQYLIVENRGALDAGPFEVIARVGLTTVAGPITVPGLAAGAAVAVGPFNLLQSTFANGGVEYVVDSASAVDECDVTDNMLLVNWYCSDIGY